MGRAGGENSGTPRVAAKPSVTVVTNKRGDVVKLTKITNHAKKFF